MNSQISEKKFESVKNNLRIKILLEKLRTKLKSFAIVDRESKMIGTVKDVNLDTKRQLNLVVSEVSPENKPRLFLLRSNHIQQVDYPNKALTVDIRQIDTNVLPEFMLPEHPSAELATLPPPHTTVEDETVIQTALSANNTSEANSIHNTDALENMSEEFEEDDLELDEDSEVVTEEVFRLLEERLVVDMTKRKIGEVIVRKEIGTRMIEVPVRYEKLIIEQVGAERKQLAVIELPHEEIPGYEVENVATQTTEVPAQDNHLIVSGEFPSPKAASLLLDAIAMQKRPGCKKVSIEIVLEDEEHRETYQKWFDRCSSK